MQKGKRRVLATRQTYCREGNVVKGRHKELQNRRGEKGKVLTARQKESQRTDAWGGGDTETIGSSA